MGINNPVPRSLSKESAKAAKILASFIKPNQIFGQEQVIPPRVLANAKGLVILTVLKAGFLFSGRAGSGVIVARLPDGGWSAPSAVMTAGAGVGGQIGAELTDFVFILNSRSAVESFSQAGSVTLGGNVSLAAGPLGRNAEAAGSATLGAVAAVFAYSKTKGLFAGVSLEGSVLVERREANRKFYGSNCTAKQILGGRVEPPPACDVLFRVLESRVFRGARPDDYDDFYDDIPDEFSDASSATDRYSTRNRSGSRSRRYDDYEDDDYEEDRYYSSRNGSGSSRTRKGAAWEDEVYDQPNRRADHGRNGFNSTYSDHPGRPSAPKPRYDRYGSDRYEENDRNGYSAGNRRPVKRFDEDAPRRYEGDRKREQDREVERSKEAQSGGKKAVALYNFKGEQSGDLSFRKGDIITVVKSTGNTDTWWTGKLAGNEGIFPANYVEMV